MIKNILFDFGGVMVGKKGGGPVALLDDNHGYKKGYIMNKISHLILEFEKGKISSNNFFDGLKEILGLDLAKELFENWKNRDDVIYYENMFNYVYKLKNIGYKCYLLSDTNEVHKKANKLSGFYDVFDGLNLSCDIGFSKKEDVELGTTRFFDYAIDKLDIKADESIFIDDLQVNCDVANKVGIKTILAKNPEQVIKDLSSILSID